MRKTVLVVALVAATACGGTGAPEPTAGGAVETRSEVPERVEWVAVFHVAGDPDELEDDTRELMRLVPDRVIVGPVGCHEGLAAELGADEGSYFSGVVARSEEELDAAIEDAGRSPSFDEEPLFRGELTMLCG